MKHLLLEPDLAAWREAARDALRRGYRPEELDLQDATFPSTLALLPDSDELPTGTPIPTPNVPRAFLDIAPFAAAHRDPQRWNLLYRLLFRLQGNRNLLHTEDDPDVAHLQRLEGQVRREVRKMHAVLRFHKVLEPTDPHPRPEVVDEPVLVDTGGRELAEEHHLLLATPTPFGDTLAEIPPGIQDCPAPPRDCDHFLAWYQPEHRVLPLAAPFFAERFATLRWTILTPLGSVSWDPATQQLAFGPGVPRDSAPTEEELEAAWRSLPAPVFTAAPKDAAQLATQPVLMPNSTQQTSAQPFLPADPTIANIHGALSACRGCDLYRHAIQVVPGYGPPGAPLMLVGEQPGDQEDQQGLPFVGPAGKVLRSACEELGIDITQVYLTNAVKHFKFVQRGKLRLHQPPRMSELTACRPWLQAEIAAGKPRVILALGASASKSLFGGTFALMRDRGSFRATPFAEQVMATLHPSAILRAPDEARRQEMYTLMKEDLALAYRTATG